MTKTIANPVPAERRRRYDRVRKTCSARELQLTIERADGDAAALLAGGEAAAAAGAVAEAVRSILLRAAAPAGTAGASREVDLALKEGLARQLEAYGMPVAASMVAAALAYDRAVAALQPASTCH